MGLGEIRLGEMGLGEMGQNQPGRWTECPSLEVGYVRIRPAAPSILVI